MSNNRTQVITIAPISAVMVCITYNRNQQFSDYVPLHTMRSYALGSEPTVRLWAAHIVSRLKCYWFFQFLSLFINKVPTFLL